MNITSARKYIAALIILIIIVFGVGILKLSHLTTCKQSRQPPVATCKQCSSLSGISDSFAKIAFPVKQCMEFENTSHIEFMISSVSRYKFMTEEKRKDLKFYCRELKRNCIHFQIRENRVFIPVLYPGFQSRHVSHLQFIQKLANNFKLPDIDFIINLGDGERSYNDLPILTYDVFYPENDMKEVAEYQGIMIPDFTFFGWPESICPSEYSHNYIELWKMYDKLEIDIADKIDVLFWRGIECPERREYVENLNVSNVDVKFMIWEKNERNGENSADDCITLADHCKYKYFLHLMGSKYSSRLKYLLMCGSVVILPQIDWLEWFYPGLIPGIHYINGGTNADQVIEALNGVRNNHALYKEIARNSKQLIQSLFSPEVVSCYFYRLIEELAITIGPFADDARGKPLEDVLMSPDLVFDVL